MDELNPVFKRVWVSRLISIIGTGLTEFGISVWIYNETGKATPMALTLLFSILPSIILAPLSGYLSDKYKRKNIIVLADSLAAVISLILFLYIKFYEYNIVVICLFIFLSATANTFDENAYTASIVNLVGKKELKKANGMNQMIDSLNSILSPIIAGALYYLIGLSGIIIIDLISYIFSMVILFTVEASNFSEEYAVTMEGEPKPKPNVWEGFKFIFSQSSLLLLLIYFTILNFLFNFSIALLEPFSLSMANSVQLGAVRAAGGIGMLLGSLVIAFSRDKFKPSTCIRCSAIIAGIGLAATGITQSIILVGVGIFTFSFFTPVATGTSSTLWMAKTPAELQGRVTAARFMVIKLFMPISYILCGPLADYVIPNILGKLKENYFSIYSLLGTGSLQYRVIYMTVGILAVLFTILSTCNKTFRKLDLE